MTIHRSGRKNLVAMVAAGSLLAFTASAWEMPKSHADVIRRIVTNPSLQPVDRDKPFASWDPEYPPPPAEASSAFKLSQEYPVRYDDDEKFPWENVDFRHEPVEYLRVVLKYCLEGMDEAKFVAQDNKVRPWYHTPWQHDDGQAANGQNADGSPGRLRAGREYLHGLTKEKDAGPGDLHPKQDKPAQAWAVGFYNQRAGYTFGRVFRTPSGYPDPSQATFPAQAVSFKLLFTDATKEKIPFLEGSLKWNANIYESTKPPRNGEKIPRINRDMLLLQIDVAIKDPRVASSTGWVFGTFVYDGGLSGATPFDRMAPVGLSWGDDPEVKPLAKVDDRVFVNEKLRETKINAALLERPGVDYQKSALLRHIGFEGRLNGPVDNAGSSCISCHGRAGIWVPIWGEGHFNEKFGTPMPFLPRGVGKASQFPVAEFDQWFAPVAPGAHLRTITSNGNKDTYMTTDYSLQIAFGIRNFYQHLRKDTALVKALADAGLVDGGEGTLLKATALPIPTRDGTAAKE